MTKGETRSVEWCKSCQAVRPDSHLYCYVCGEELVATEWKPLPIKSRWFCLFCESVALPQSTGALVPHHCGGPECRRKAKNLYLANRYYLMRGLQVPPPASPICQICGGPMPEPANRHHKYCSVYCRKVADAMQAREKYWRTHEGVATVCRVCKRPLPFSRARAVGYCSNLCQSRAERILHEGVRYVVPA